MDPLDPEDISTHRLRRVLLACIAALFVVSVAWEPRRPDIALLRGIPLHTSAWVSLPKPASHWPGILANPVIAGALGASGMDESKRQRLARRESTAAWIRRLASEHAHRATSPFFSSSGQPAVVFTSWVGSKSPLFINYLRLFPLKGFTRAGAYRGRPIYLIDTGAEPGEPRLWVTLAEGILVGVLHPDPDSLPAVLDVFDGYHPSLIDDRTRRYAEVMAWSHGSAATGYAWIPGGQLPGPASFRIDNMDAQSLALTLRFPAIPDELTQTPAWEPSGFSARLIGARQTGTLLLPTRLVRGLSNLIPPGITRDVIAGLAGTPDVEWMTISLLTEEWGARIRGILAPALAIIWHTPTATPDPAHETLRNAVAASLAPAFRTTMLPEAIPDTPLFPLAEATRTRYSKNFSGEDRFTLTHIEGNTLFTTNQRVASALLSRIDSPASTFEAERVAWRITEPRSPAGGGHLDVSRIAKIIDEALAAYSLRQLLRDNDDANALDTIAKTRAVCQALATMGTIRLSSHIHPDGVYYTLETSAPHPPGTP